MYHDRPYRPKAEQPSLIFLLSKGKIQSSAPYNIEVVSRVAANCCSVIFPTIKCFFLNSGDHKGFRIYLVPLSQFRRDFSGDIFNSMFMYQFLQRCCLNLKHSAAFRFDPGIPYPSPQNPTSGNGIIQRKMVTLQSSVFSFKGHLYQSQPQNQTWTKTMQTKKCY